ncbi:hypothetical protein EJB05_29608, partial [Eragrostis curvula]
MDDSTMMKPTPPPSPLSVAKLAAKKIPLLPLFVSVKVACTLALIIAVVLAACAADELINSPCDPVGDILSFSLVHRADGRGRSQGGGPRARAAVGQWDSSGRLASGAPPLRPLQPGRRHHRAHCRRGEPLCMGAVVDAIFITAAPGNHALKMDSISFDVFFAVLDLIGFVVLILG